MIEVWAIHDYGIDEYGPCRRVVHMELTEREVVVLLNHYRTPDTVPRITYYLSEAEARAMAKQVEVKP